MNYFKRILFNLLAFGVVFFNQVCLADTETQDIGDIADNLTFQIKDMHNTIIVIAYVAGFGFMIASMFKFKQHKESPQQVPIGGGIALFVVAVLLVFMPALITPTQESIYGSAK